MRPALIDRVGPNPVLQSWGYADAFLRQPEIGARLPQPRFWRDKKSGLWTPVPLWAAAAFITNKAAGSAGGNTVTTAAADTTGATLIMLGVAEVGGASTATPSDSKVNSAPTKIRTDSSGTVQWSLFYLVPDPAKVGAGHTFTYTLNSSFPALFMTCFSGTSATPTDGNTGFNDVAITSIQPGSITPSASGDVFVAGMAFGGSRTISVSGTGWAISDQIDFLAAGGNYGGAMAYKVSAGSGAENPTFSWSVGLSAGCNMGAFLAAAGGGFTAKSRRTMGYRVGSRS